MEHHYDQLLDSWDIDRKFPETESYAEKLTRKIGEGIRRAAGHEDVSPFSLIRGFGPMTRIETSFGEVYAQVLRETDLIRTYSGEYLRIRSLDRVTLDEDFLHYHPESRPVCIRRGSLAPNLPVRDTSLAPNQRIKQGQAISSSNIHVAKDALARPRVELCPVEQVTYTYFHFGKPVAVKADGVWVIVEP